MITIDGSKGGGQLLRSSLTLSLLTGQKFRIHKIRSNRPKPGLQRQHLVCVRAAQAISNAAVDGDEIGSKEIVFSPGSVKSGHYTFPIGSAGSTSLVLQTIALPLAICGAGESTVSIGGGTHNPMAPPFEFLESCFSPVLAAMGVLARVQLLKPGFFPAGGGELKANIQPMGDNGWKPLSLTRWGEVISLHAIIYSAHLRPAIAERELVALHAELAHPLASTQLVTPESDGPGNCVLVKATSDAGWSEVVTQCGEMQRSAESVAINAARGMNKFLSLTSPVGMHLQDQLLIPLLLGGGEFLTGPLREHFTSNQEVVRNFLGKLANTEDLGRGRTRVWAS